MIRIGIDIQASCGRVTGLGRYTQSLVEALREQNPEDMEFRFYRDDREEDLNTIARLWWENVSIPKRMAHDPVDILHTPAFSPPLCGRHPRMVVTVHDLIGMLYPNQKGLLSSFYWAKWLPWSVRRADAIIADSEYTKKDVARYLEVPSEKIAVVYPSGHEGFRPDLDKVQIAKVKASYGIRGPYFLFVGSMEPRKNLKGLIEAFAAFLKESEDRTWQLVAVGSHHFAHGKIYRELIREFPPMDSQVIFTDYIGHPDLNALYCGASAFVFPSFYEGFGIPVLEAMACGTPVLASCRTSIPEVAGEAALLVDPQDQEAMVKGLRELSQNKKLVQTLREKSRKQVQRFSWHNTATKTLNVYRKLVKYESYALC